MQYPGRSRRSNTRKNCCCLCVMFVCSKNVTPTHHIGCVCCGVSQVDVATLPAAHVVLTGPSCLPFSRTGKQHMWDDPHAVSFSTAIELITHQAGRRDTKLQIFVIENAMGLADKTGGTSHLQDVISLMKGDLGDDWDVWHWTMKTQFCGLPQKRVRLYICGRKKSKFQTRLRLNPNDMKLTHIDLVRFLDPSLPHQLHQLTDLQKRTLNSYRELARNRNVPDGSIARCDLS
eukprot:367003-Pyramimonas_sp.AAC.1